MSQFVSGILTLLLPFVSGPLMALLLPSAAISQRRRITFGLLLLFVDGAVFLVLAWDTGSLIGFSTVSCFLTPFAALASSLITTWRGRSLVKAWGDEAHCWRWYRRMAVVIPLLQLLVIFLLVLLGPTIQRILCETGLGSCDVW